jgi:hypothetical protein
MNLFDEQVLRLKQATKVTADQDVAALLSMTKAAFSERKKRGSFPTTEVFALAAQRPDLAIDPDWIVTGASVHAAAQDKGESAVLEHYRLMSPQMAKMFLKIAATMSGATEMSGADITQKLAAASKLRRN